ncbi:MAG: hypothetical protein A3I38_02295 [Candidatus Wildermuthbacteria bacterium RIFCSPLOWO2_02_FULL_47_10]|uniref:Uncharacterized protein n=1 Tax=Candidatus Wildermuthbacteria bacterium RIFCSPHIGHO2_02_FULL_47_17 TaxID=1802452 RepID=A0A1G2R8A3_9BACT|nr:MAG: hypothetical protein A3D59_01145 [Candidatus Wildermuthbacteria bacterium RIFCSPHIGHO2_02_FULL_47_17]OHA75716.1 MAG: hypothetical protein A3I38_02295 [Candidatus Wildermuthbacteria bacterium RIFCSPLOWO2_02_FULL_47_10]
MYILGAGGMAREVKVYFDDLGIQVGGFVEQNSHRSGQELKGSLVIDAIDLGDPGKIELIAGIGSPLRRRWVEDLEAGGYRFKTLIHKNAYVGEDVKIGDGSIVCPGTIITTDVQIGRHCILNVKASINHDCVSGDFVTISPGATIGGGVEIGDETWVGIGATIIQRVKIGKGVFIAAGAVVVNDIPDNSLVMGIPAKVVRQLTPESWKTLI